MEHALTILAWGFVIMAVTPILAGLLMVTLAILENRTRKSKGRTK